MYTILSRAALSLIILCLGVIPTLGQEPSRETLNLKRKQLSDIEDSLVSEQKSVGDLNQQLKKLLADIEEKKAKKAQLEASIPIEEELVAFYENPAGTVVDVLDSEALLVKYEGRIRPIYLDGVFFDPERKNSTVLGLRKRFKKKAIHLRCVDSECGRAYFYEDKKGRSLNAELVIAGLAFAAATARFDVAPLYVEEGPNGSQRPRAVGSSVIVSEPGSGSSSSSNGTTSRTSSSTSEPSSRSSSGTVNVRGYTRKDGTYVPSHTRSAPGSKSRKR